MKHLERARTIISRFKTEVEVYRLVIRHSRTPRLSKILLGIAIAYAISPIDLIPDFIPVLGYLDDVILLPILIWAATRLIPKEIVLECRSKVESVRNGQPGVVADLSRLQEPYRDRVNPEESSKAGASAPGS